jgi:hypothetical protein
MGSSARVVRVFGSAVLLAALVLCGVSTTDETIASAGTPLPGAGGCPMFPADNVWNTKITNLPVNPHSAQWLASMDAATTNLHPDFGPSGDPTNPYGMPYTIVPTGHPFVNVAFQYASESDPGPYPFGPDTPIEGGQDATGDRHAIMVDPTTCTLYELYDARYSATGSTAGSGAIWNLRSNALRPAGWTSADAAGLPILPGLVRYDEVESGSITHAIRMTAETTDTSYLWPARHEAGARSDPDLPPMGARFRLKASFDISGFSPQAQVVLRAMQQYGLIVADNGSNWYFGGTADPSWPVSLIDELKQVPASAFEAVDESSLMVSPDSGQASSFAGPVTGMAAAPSGSGYWLTDAEGAVSAHNVPSYGSMAGTTLNAPINHIVSTPDGKGYWLVAADGGTFAFGDAGFYGSMGGQHLNAPVVNIAPTPDGGGYWLVASDGGVFSFGDARFFGSMGGTRLNQAVVGIASDAQTGGYWLVASDGGIFAFGAPFFGSTGGIRLQQPVNGMASTSSGDGYWLVASDGGIFAYGGAQFWGSTGGIRLNAPIMGMAADDTTGGYWMVGSDGGVFSFDAPFEGSD